MYHCQLYGGPAVRLADGSKLVFHHGVIDAERGYGGTGIELVDGSTALLYHTEVLSTGDAITANDTSSTLRGYFVVLKGTISSDVAYIWMRSLRLDPGTGDPVEELHYLGP